MLSFSLVSGKLLIVAEDTVRSKGVILRQPLGLAVIRTWLVPNREKRETDTDSRTLRPVLCRFYTNTHTILVLRYPICTNTTEVK